MHIISNQILQIYKHFLELREVVKALESEIRLCHLMQISTTTMENSVEIP